MDRYYTNPFSRLLKSRLKNPDEIVSSGLDRFPSYMDHNMEEGVAGSFSTGQNRMKFNPLHTTPSVIEHEARHAGIRQLLRDYGVSGRNKKFVPQYLPNSVYEPIQKRTLKNRDLEKMSGLLGYRGNPNSDTMFNLGEYIDNGQGKYNYSLDDDRMLAGVIPAPKSLYEQMEDKALKSFGVGVRPIKKDMDFEHSIIYNLKPTTTGGKGFDPVDSVFQNHRELRARDIYNKLIDLRERKQEGRFSDNASGMQNVENTNIAPYNTKFLEEKEDPVNWYNNVHSFLSPQANAGIIDYQPDNQQQNQQQSQQQSQQPIAPQIPNTPVSPNPHIDPPLVPDEIIIPVPDTKTDEMVRVWGPSYGGVPSSENITQHMADWILTNYPDSETSNRYQQSGWDTSKGTGPDSGWVPLYNYPILSYNNEMAQAYADANPD